jgi:hypothetical protein
MKVYPGQPEVEGSGTGTKKLVFRRISVQEEQEYTIPFSLRGVAVVIREHDKIVRETLYYDVAELYCQLGIKQ